jgi:hypothetical protein
LLVTLFGRSILSRFQFFANPKGSFRKVLGVFILIVGIMITFGTIKKLQTWVVENGNFTFIGMIEEKLNDQIDTKSLKKETMMCGGGICESRDKKNTEAFMDEAKAQEFTGI